MKKKTKEELKWIIVGALISYSITFTINELSKSPDVEVYIEPILKDGVNTKYLPLIVENSGDIDLSNILISINTCKMGDDPKTEYFEYYELDYLRAHSTREIQFANQETIKNFSRKDCSPYVDVFNRSVAGPFYIPFPLNETINQTVVACGYCYYDVYFYSDKLNKSFVNQTFRSPIDLTFIASPVPFE